jgi:flagellar basal-body rod protein FlgF
MNAAMYKAVSGSVAQMRRLDVATQNLANLKTAAYKGQRLAFGEVLAQTPDAAERTGGMVAIAEQRTDFSQGELQHTGNDFDLAIDGEGFFVVQGRQGRRYTRQGTFTLSPAGTMMNAAGESVMGEDGPIQVSGKKIEVTPQGVVRSEAGEMGRLRIVGFADPRGLTKEARGLYRAPDGTAPRPAAEYRVLQGSVEQSNVNPIDAMVTLITLHRQFEAYGKVLQMMDSATGKMLSEGARL